MNIENKQTAINAYYKKQREEFIKTSIRTPRITFSDDCLINTRGFGLTVDELYEGSPRYTGKIEKVGDQTPSLEYMKQRKIL